MRSWIEEILELRKQVLDLQNENIELKVEIKTLWKQLDLR